MTCNHDRYWTGIYGNCMACRAEKAEARCARLEGALAVLQRVAEAGWRYIDEPDDTLSDAAHVELVDALSEARARAAVGS